LWYAFCQYVCMMLVSVAFNLRVCGRRNVPAKGPVILVSNHQSYLDPVLLGAGLRRAPEIHYLARSSLFEFSKFFAWLIRSLNAVPIDLERFSKESIRVCIDILSRGNMLTVFPEGTRTADGSIGPMQNGFGLIARRSRATIVPVLIQGSYEAWPRKQLLPRPHPTTVRYGCPIEPEQVRKLGRNIAQYVRSELVAMMRNSKCR